MAEVTGLRNNALPYPVYGAPWGVVFPMLDADGDLVTGATTPDAEVSKNGDTFADCTNESTEIATNSGMYYLLLTGAEMTADVVAVIAKSATAGMKTTPIALYPRKLVSLRAGTVAANAADGTTLQLDSGASAVDDYYNGCLLVGTLDSNVEARIISDYVGSTKVCTVSPAFVTTPDNNDTFVVYIPDGGRQMGQSDLSAIGAAAVSTTTAQFGVNVVQWNTLTTVALPLVPTTAGRTLDVSAGGEAGIDWANIGSPTTTVGLSGTTVKTATDVETDTQDIQARLPAALVGGRIDASVGAMAANVLTATAIAADAITDAKVASDVTIASVTGAVGSVTGAVGSVTGAVGSVTGNVGGNVTGTIGGLTAAALKDFFDTDSTTTFASAVSGSVVAEIANNAGGSALTEAGIAAAVWDLDATGHQTQGTFGQTVGDSVAGASLITRIGAAGAGLSAIPWNAAWDAEVQSEVDDALVAQNLDHLVKIAVDTNFATTVHADSVVGQLADNGAGFDRSTDSLEAIRDRGDAAWTTATGFSIHSAADVWAVATRLLTAGTNIVLAKGTGVTGFNDLSAAQVNAEADTALSDVGLTTTITGRIDAAVTTRATPAQVNAEVVDALAVDTYAEPGQGSPAANITLALKISYLFKAFRNRTTQTATEYALYADDATTKDQKAAVSDDGTTFERGEITTGA